MPAADVAAFGRNARWLLLLCTLFGLATMHTLGHAGIRMDGHTLHSGPIHAAGVVGAAHGGAGPASSTEQVMAASPKLFMAASPARVTAAPCTDDDCPGGHEPGGMGAWSVCLAILGGLALVTLIGALLTRRHDRAGPGDEATTTGPVSRAPPVRQHGIRITSLTVLRI